MRVHRFKQMRFANARFAPAINQALAFIALTDLPEAIYQRAVRTADKIINTRSGRGAKAKR